jgi:shikimate dehydrogenase
MTPTLCGVLGHPVGHSRSPAIQNAAFEATGLDWRYVKLPVPPELFDETVRALPGSGYRGANVTIPHKLAALRAADEATPAARAIGAANTLTFADVGGIAADNTDAGGLLDALARPVAGLRALVLGAGGAGRAAVYALRDAGAAEVMLWNRTPERGAAVADELGAVRAEHPGPADLLVNATSVGLDPAVPDEEALAQLGLTGAEPYPAVVDLVYREAGPTPVQAWAQAAGSSVVGGLEVLVRQGARSFEAWTGRAAPVDVMRAAARKTSAGS